MGTKTKDMPEAPADDRIHRYRARAPDGKKGANGQHRRSKGQPISPTRILQLTHIFISLVQTVADVIRTCLGPKAMLKMILDPMGGILYVSPEIPSPR